MPIEEYAREIVNKISPEEVRFISKISNNRVCIYSLTEELADEIIKEHKQVLINGKYLDIKPLVIRNTRIIISNIQQSILYYELKRILLTRCNVKSNITLLCAGIGNQAYA